MKPFGPTLGEAIEARLHEDEPSDKSKDEKRIPPVGTPHIQDVVDRAEKFFGERLKRKGQK